MPFNSWMTGGFAAVAFATVINAAPPEALAPGDEPASVPEVAATIEPAVYEWVFGRPTERDAGRNHVDAVLQQNFVIIDRLCGLSDAQREKVVIVRQADCRRFMERVEAIERAYHLSQSDEQKLVLLRVDAAALNRELTASLCTERWLLPKVLKRELSKEQNERFESFRNVCLAGGFVSFVSRRDESASNEAPPALSVCVPSGEFEDLAALRLRTFPNLTDVGFKGTRVSDDGLVHLRHLTELQRVSLDETRITDAGLANLSGLHRLRELKLGKTAVSSSGLVHLKDLGELRYLSIPDTNVTDDGLPHLKGLKKLEWLDLDNTAVTDEGLMHLSELSELFCLTVRGTRVTPEGAARLRRELPVLGIHSSEWSSTASR